MEKMLEFTLSDDGKGYIVAGIGSCTDMNIAIPSTHNGLPVTSIGKKAFEGYDSLTSIEIPNSVTSIGDSAFYGCTSLTSIEIPNSVTSIGNSAFYSCDSLASITVSENNNSYKSIDGSLYSKDGKELIQYALGKKETIFAIPSGVTSIGDYAFSSCKSLTRIVIPNSVTSIGKNAFCFCDSLTSINISQNVPSIGKDAFSHCDRLTDIIFRDNNDYKSIDSSLLF